MNRPATSKSPPMRMTSLAKTAMTSPAGMLRVSAGPASSMPRAVIWALR